MYLEESNYIERQGFSNLDIYNDYVKPQKLAQPMRILALLDNINLI